MPSREQQATILMSDGGKMLADYPPAAVGAANFVSLINWRTDGEGAGRELVKREGWLPFRPNTSAAEAGQATMGSALVSALGEVTRPNGQSVPVGVGGDKIYWFDFDSGAWQQIASGLSTSSTYRWQIVNVNQYAIFNNGVDLPYYWTVGMANALPIYELREQGIASVGYIWEFNDQLMCADVLEILNADLPTILNSGTPYAAVTDPTKTQRISYRILWSNFGDPLDFAAVVNGAGTTGTPTLTLAWPMTSFTVGTEIVVVGGGASGGNLTTTISNIAGAVLTLADNLGTTVTAAPTLKATALASVVGSFDLLDTGEAVIAAAPLQNRLVVYKRDGIFLCDYTGVLEEPFAFQRIYSGTRVPRWRYTLVSLSGREHIYAGDRHFYSFNLGTDIPRIVAEMEPSKESLFFNPLEILANDRATYAVDNVNTGEVWFFISALTTSVLAYDYVHGDCHSISGAGFSACALIKRPLANERADQSLLWFIMGGINGAITQNGSTNASILTYLRNGAAFASSWITGTTDMGSRWASKTVTAWALLNPPQLNLQCSVTISGAHADEDILTALESFSLNATGSRSITYLFYERALFSESFTTSVITRARVQGRIWTYLGDNPSGIDRRASKGTVIP